MGKAFNGSFHAGILEFELIMQISEGIDVVYSQTVNEFEPKFEAIHCM